MKSIVFHTQIIIQWWLCKEFDLKGDITMHANDYVALQLHKMREAEMRANLHVPAAVAEAIRLEKQEILRLRKIRHNG